MLPFLPSLPEKSYKERLAASSPGPLRRLQGQLVTCQAWIWPLDPMLDQAKRAPRAAFPSGCLAAQTKRWAEGINLRPLVELCVEPAGLCSRVMVGESGLKTRRRTLKVFLGSQQETLGSLDLSR